jgi:hypothetical protein
MVLREFFEGVGNTLEAPLPGTEVTVAGGLGVVFTIGLAAYGIKKLAQGVLGSNT